MSVTLGKPAPDFTAKATSNQTVSLEDLRGKNVVLFFYPKDNTPGCTSEGQAFTEHFDAFHENDTIIFGVSKDGLESHETFKAAQAFPFELISDEDEALCKLFDVIRLKTMNGEEFMGIERSTFLIDKDGILQHEWRKVRLKGHVDDVLQASYALCNPTPVEEPKKPAATDEVAEAD
ncbi:peroxiredoxin [Spongorhabdus nitratireducens]